MKTDRITILVTPDEKAQLNARAEAAGLNASEFVRRAVERFDVNSDEAMAALMLDEMRRNISEMNKTLDRVNAKVEADLEHLRQARRDRDAAVKKAA